MGRFWDLAVNRCLVMMYKLPKNVTLANDKKWIDLDYWFTVDQIKVTKV